MRRSLLKLLQGAPALLQTAPAQQQAALYRLPAVQIDFQRDDEQQQQQPAAQQQVRNLHASALPSSLQLPSRRPAMTSLLPRDDQQLQQVRSMAGPPTSSDNTVPENTWAKFRADYGVEKRNDLAAGMYALILVFSLSAITNELYAYPPRIAAMTGFIFFLLYRRKGNA